MPEPDAFYPPAQYDAIWLVWLLLALVMLSGLAALLLLLGREQPVPPPVVAAPPPAPPTVPPNTLREQYRKEITRFEERYRSGEIDERTAHQAFSRLVRAFVSEHSGLEAPVLTLSELTERKVDASLLTLMRKRLYPGSFKERSPMSVEDSAKAARSLVAKWR